MGYVQLCPLHVLTAPFFLIKFLLLYCINLVSFITMKKSNNPNHPKKSICFVNVFGDATTPLQANDSNSNSGSTNFKHAKIKLYSFTGTDCPKFNGEFNRSSSFPLRVNDELKLPLIQSDYLVQLSLTGHKSMVILYCLSAPK